MALTADMLFEYMIENCGIYEDELGIDVPLFSSGILDSFNLIKVMGYVEQEVGIKVAATHVTLDNFDSVERILKYAQQQSA